MIITLMLIKNAATSKSKKEFVKDFIKAWFYMYSCAISVIDEDIVSKHADTAKDIIGSLTRRGKRLLKKGRNVEYENHIIYDMLNNQQNTIVNHRTENLSYINEICNELKLKKKIFLAPTGNAGSCMLDVLTRQGVSVLGFFDNDEQKEGMELKGVPVRLPAAAPEIIGGKPATILIVSMYRNVRENLRQQFISLGIPEDDLIVIEF
jgi:hypothetical protein